MSTVQLFTDDKGGLLRFKFHQPKPFARLEGVFARSSRFNVLKVGKKLYGQGLPRWPIPASDEASTEMAWVLESLGLITTEQRLTHERLQRDAEERESRAYDIMDFEALAEKLGVKLTAAQVRELK